MFNIGVIYQQFSSENDKRVEIIYSALEKGDRVVLLPVFGVKDSRIIETRAVLSDLGDRISKYYGFESVEIGK
jgi:hypothetical protein